MLALPRQETILLSDGTGGRGRSAERRLSLGGARRLESVAELAEPSLLPSVAVLVLDSWTVPSGRLLAALGRLSVEHPGIQKVALLSADPPLPVATYLTSCGVHILLDRSDDESGADGLLTAVIASLKERARWSTS